MAYLPTFTIKINQMYANIPYMEPMGSMGKYHGHPRSGTQKFQDITVATLHPYNPTQIGHIWEVNKTLKVDNPFFGWVPIKGLSIPSRKLTYPTLGKGNSSSNMPCQGDMLVPWRVPKTCNELTYLEMFHYHFSSDPFPPPPKKKKTL